MIYDVVLPHYHKKIVRFEGCIFIQSLLPRHAEPCITRMPSCKHALVIAARKCPREGNSLPPQPSQRGGRGVANEGAGSDAPSCHGIRQAAAGTVYRQAADGWRALGQRGLPSPRCYGCVVHPLDASLEAVSLAAVSYIYSANLKRI